MILPAIGESLKKLNPVTLARNPVMLVAGVGAAISTFLLATVGGANFGFQFQITLLIWVIVLSANFAEAMAEGRGSAQARALRTTLTQTFGRRLKLDGTVEKIPQRQLRKGDVVIVSAGELIPGDGEVIAGAASVDESAMTGESAPVIRESGSDRSAVTGGTKVLSDQIKVRINSNPGETFVDRMISLVEGTNRQKTPNEIVLTVLLSALTLIFLIVVMSMKAFGIASSLNLTIPVLVALLVGLIPTTIGGLLSAIGIAGIDRLVGKNVLASSGRAVEAAGDVDVLLLDKTGTVTMGNRQATDFLPAPGMTKQQLADAAQLASFADETPEGRSIVILAKKFGIRARQLSEMSNVTFLPFTRSNPDERCRSRWCELPERGARPRFESTLEEGCRIRSKRILNHCEIGWNTAGSCQQRTGTRHSSPQGYRKRRPARSVRPIPRDGNSNRDDHRRQRFNCFGYRAGSRGR